MGIMDGCRRRGRRCRYWSVNRVPRWPWLDAPAMGTMTDIGSSACASAVVTVHQAKKLEPDRNTQKVPWGRICSIVRPRRAPRGRLAHLRRPPLLAIAHTVRPCCHTVRASFMIISQ